MESNLTTEKCIVFLLILGEHILFSKINILLLQKIEKQLCDADRCEIYVIELLMYFKNIRTRI